MAFSGELFAFIESSTIISLRLWRIAIDTGLSNTAMTSVLGA